MKKVIVPTGYMGSGSSVVTDLVSEFEGFQSAQGTFEYVFLHCPNGVFDLEDKLLLGNNAIRSDEALHAFRDTMKQLYDKKYWWVGHYKDIVGERFWSATEEYIQALVQYQPDFYWYYQENTNGRMFLQLIWKRLVKLFTLNKIQVKKPLLYSPMWVSYVTPEQFYRQSKKYINTVLKELGADKENIILDQLLLPHNLFRMHNYFDDNMEVFVIDRDPRDMFLMNKYVWPSQNGQVPYPTDVTEFCQCYRSLREMEERRAVENDHVHRFHFEDFIYRYDETICRVQNVLGRGGAYECPKHLLKKQYFEPEKSINNTQLFRQEQWQAESQKIAEMLPEYLYDFPYSVEGNPAERF